MGCQNCKMNCIVQELFFGTPVEAKWVDGNSYEAMVIGFPPNTERVRVKFINDGIKCSALVQHVTTCSKKGTIINMIMIFIIITVFLKQVGCFSELFFWFNLKMMEFTVNY